MHSYSRNVKKIEGFLSKIVFFSLHTKPMESSGIEYIDTGKESLLPLCEGDQMYDSDFSADFEQTLTMLDMDVEEVMFEVQNSHEEVGLNIETK